MQPQPLFTNYIIAGVEASLARVQAAEYVVPEADRQQAWHLLSFALKLDEAWPVTRKLLLALAPKMELAGFREEWIPYLEKGLQCAQTVDDEQTTAECELQIGIVYRLLSRFKDAHDWTAKSVKRFSRCGNAYSKARALNELAWLEHLEHRYEDATGNIEKALPLLADDAHAKAMSYRVQGMIAFHKGNLQEATAYHHKALEIFIQHQDQRGTAWSLQNLAIALQWQNKFTEAFDCYSNAVTTLTKIGDVSNLGVVQMNLGSAYYSSGESSKAVEHFINAKLIAYKLDDKLQLARINTHLGLAYLALNSYVKAEKAFYTSIDYYTALQDHSWQLNAMDGLAMTYLKSQQYDRAIAILYQAFATMPAIAGMPNYDYLQKSLAKHLEEAKKGQASWEIATA